MRIRVALIALLVSVAISFYAKSIAPAPYNLYESLPIAGYGLLFWGVIHFLPRTPKMIAAWIVGAILPYVWAVLVYGLLLSAYADAPRPYASWDVRLTFVWVFYVVVLYMYSLAVAINETVVWKRTTNIPKRSAKEKP